MRKGYDHKVLEIDGVFWGFCLGADFTSEHEWGIKGLYRSFGIPEETKKLGVKSCKASFFPEDEIHFKEDGKEAVLVLRRCMRYCSADFLKLWDEGSVEDVCKVLAELYYSGGGFGGDDKDPDLSTAWSENDFGIRVRGDKKIAQLKELYEAMKKKNICFLFLGGYLIGNAGLCICIADKVPEELNQQMIEKQKEDRKLKKADEKTDAKSHLKMILANAGKQYFALSPRWSPKGRNKTKYDITYLLNPMGQDKYKWGEFTVEELLQWAEDKGPVIMKKKID